MKDLVSIFDQGYLNLQEEKIPVNPSVSALKVGAVHFAFGEDKYISKQESK